MLRASGAMMKLAGAIDVVVRPHRGLDLGAASFEGRPFAWLTPLGEDGADGRRVTGGRHGAAG